MFLTAPLRRALRYKRMLVHQWFDLWDLHEYEQRPELQNDGLRETSLSIHQLIRAEADLVGAGHVVLLGLSQGCAASLVAGLLWTEEPFGALVGMCGWLPYQKAMEEVISDKVEDDDIFESDNPGQDSKSGPEASSLQKALSYLVEELGFSIPANESTATLEPVPIFSGHGALDEKVPFSLGQEAASFLRSLKVDVTFREYPGLGHWYSNEMLRDIVIFIKGHLDTTELSSPTGVPTAGLADQD